MILIDNPTQPGLLTMAECVDVLERAFGAIDSGQAIYRPKTDVNVPTSKTNEYYRFGSMEGWFDGIRQEPQFSEGFRTHSSCYPQIYPQTGFALSV